MEVKPDIRVEAHKKLDELLDRAESEQLYSDVLAGIRLSGGKPQIIIWEIKGTAKP